MMYPTIDNLMNILLMGLMFYVAVAYITEGKFTWMVLAICAISFFISFFTLIRGGRFYASPYMAIGLAMLTDMGLRKHPVTFLQSWVTLATVLIPINLICMYMYPLGIRNAEFNFYSHWILGYYGTNGLSIFFTAVILYSTVKFGRLTLWNFILLAAIVWTGILGGSQSTVIAVVSLSVFVALLYNRNLPKMFNYASYLIGIGVFFVAVILLRLQKYMSWFIEDILGKRLDFTYRTYLWDYALSYIKRNPFLGAGTGAIGNQEVVAGTELLLSGDPHNLIITVFYTGGIFAFLALMAIILLAAKPLMKHKAHPIASLLAFSLFAWLLSAMTWTLAIFPYLVPIFLMADHLEILIALAEEYRFKIKLKRIRLIWGNQTPSFRKE